MANPGVVLLILFAIFLTIGIIILVVWAGVDYYKNIGGGTGTNILPPCSRDINVSSLIQIPTNGSANCIQQGSTGTFYYIGNLGSGEYDYVVAAWGSKPFDVCIGFCHGYTGGACTGPIYAGKSAQTNFDNCMSQLSSSRCTPPIPIAARGTILYYPYSPTCNVCSNCRGFS